MSQASLIPTTESPFVFQSHTIRTVMQDGQPWFVARDVCEALDIAWRGNTLSAIPAEWTCMRNLRMIQQNRSVKLVSEAAVYKLAFRSNKPEADNFTNWIASGVVPSIRKTGKYQAVEEPTSQSPLQRIYTLPAGKYVKATKDERHPIDHARKAWVAAAAANGRVIQHSDSWKIIRGHFGNITRIDDLPAAWVMDAVRFCQEMLAHETMVKIREERELEERAERRATAALPAPAPEPAQAPLPVSIAQLDIAGIETAMEEATRRQLAYSEAVFNLMNKVRAPFWEREGRQASPALKGLMQAMARGLGDIQMTAAYAHNAVFAVEGCKLLADEGRA